MTAAATAFDRRTIPAAMRLDHWIAQDGWALRRFRWDAERPRGSLLFQAGRGDYLEKYLEPMAHWQARGWCVAGFDWRGQGGSRPGAEQTGVNHAASLDPMVDDLAAFVADWVRDSPGPHMVLGHSMGGHLMLRLLAERAPAVQRAVLVAPMLGLATGPLSPRAARWIAATATRAGWRERPLWSHEREGASRDRQRFLTGCEVRYADAAWWRERRPELTLGAPTWGWIASALQSIGKLDRPGALEDVATPVLLLAAPGDRLVSTPAIRRAADRLPHAELRIVPEAAHEILRERDAVRLPVLAAIDRFLDAP